MPNGLFAHVRAEIIGRSENNVDCGRCWRMSDKSGVCVVGKADSRPAAAPGPILSDCQGDIDRNARVVLYLRGEGSDKPQRGHVTYLIAVFGHARADLPIKSRFMVAKNGVVRDITAIVRESMA